jgi:hypothetical protein
MGNEPWLLDSIVIKLLNFAFKVYLLDLGSRVCTIFRDYNEVVNLRIPRYVHGKCSYCMKIIINREKNSDRRWTFVQHILEVQ